MEKGRARVKVSSDLDVAHDAVSGFAKIQVDEHGQRVVLGASNVSSMQAGARVANETPRNISELISGAKSEATKLIGLAAEIEGRDSRDASGWGETA